MLRSGVGLLVVMFCTLPAHAADEEAEPVELPAQKKLTLDWYKAWSHVVRVDIAPGRWQGRNLGAGGLALQWEWWPTPHLAYTARTWMQNILVDPVGETSPRARRQASGMQLGLQVGTPGPVKLVAGAGTGVAFVNGRLPPSDRWSLRPAPMSGVVEAHGGIMLLAHPVSLHALAWVHLYTEGPPVFSLSFGGGPVMRPAPPPEDDGVR